MDLTSFSFCWNCPSCSNSLPHEMPFSALGPWHPQQTTLLCGCPSLFAQALSSSARQSTTGTRLLKLLGSQMPPTGLPWPLPLRVLYPVTEVHTVKMYLSPCSGFKCPLRVPCPLLPETLLWVTMAHYAFPTAGNYLTSPPIFELNCLERKGKEENKRKKHTSNIPWNDNEEPKVKIQ